MKEKIYYIEGMHCASCELLIEKKVLKEEGVTFADASLSNGTLRIQYRKRPIHVNKLNDWFKDDGYTFSETKKEEKKEPFIYFQDGKGIQIDKKILKKKLKTLFSISIVFFVLYLIEKSGVSQYVSVHDDSSLGVFFVFGIVAGLSSCAALVGGILLSLTKNWNTQYGYDASTMTKMQPHFYFHGGRIFSYAVLGAILGSLGSAFAFENVTVYAIITLLVSFVMLLIGLQMAGVKWAEKFQIRMPKALTRNISDTKKQGKKLPFAIGAGTVLLPCGFTLIAQGIALTSGSAIKGALMLVMFVLGTMIPLLFIGVASSEGSKSAKRGKVFSFYAGIVLVMFALYNVNGQLNVLGYPSISDVLANSSNSEQTNEEVGTNKQGEQIVEMLAKGFDYKITSGSTIKAGVPTKLVVDDQGMLGCGKFLASRGLINGYVSLRDGKNIIDLGKPKKGTYKLTCSMGMVSPVTLKVK